LFLLLNLIAPATAGPFGVLAIFVFAYLSSLGVMTFLLFGISGLISYLSKEFVFRRPIERLSFKNSFFYSSIIAASPIMLIGLRSVGETTIYSYSLVVLFTLIGCLYISKRI
jgi:hypothetical protein